ncbi:hypothetical protein CPB83DRAFT_908657 [Crepidotus variabilis]|uniref:F-box domain-containing protein n=1 Tax=Crepidotus variabilis TaxID=179855 RepID=A0A9P6EBT6_9AGAR|nr:hypothetical protein CPB83DRAFT_908657 [Crepidotus variabilis]
MLDLPPELWREIASFIEKKEMTPLLGVNQLLRGCALDRIYEQTSIDLGELGQSDYLQDIGHLGYPSYAIRIRKLSISTTRNVLKTSTKAHSRRNLKASARTSLDALSKFHDILRGRKLSKSEIAQRLFLSFVRLKEIELFCVDEEEQEDFQAQMPLLLSSFQAYSSTLTSIGFSVAPLSFLSTLLPALPTVPTLERLSFRLMDYRVGSRIIEFDQILKHTIAPFISRHRETLSFLQVISNSFSKEYDLLPLFENLGYIPHLKTLEIPFVLTRLSTSQSFSKLLKRHSETLEDLILFIPFNTSRLSSTEGSFATISTPLPRLKDLAIYSIMNTLHMANHASTDLMDYISKYSSQLSKFAVYMKLFAWDDWKAFAGMNWNRLTSLSLRLSVATPTVFDAFSSNFPSLKSLSLIVSAYQESFGADGSKNKFCDEMSSRSYPTGSLTHLDIHHKNHEHHHPHLELRSSDMSCVGAVVKAFPSVISVNERHRTNFLQDLATSDSHRHRGGSRFVSR